MQPQQDCGMRRGTPLSTRMKALIRAYPGHRYQLALMADLSPSTLSGWLVGYYSPAQGDPRALRLAELVGCPASEVSATADDGPADGDGVAPPAA